MNNFLDKLHSFHLEKLAVDVNRLRKEGKEGRLKRKKVLAKTPELQERPKAVLAPQKEQFLFK